MCVAMLTSLPYFFIKFTVKLYDIVWFISLEPAVDINGDIDSVFSLEIVLL